ncbi:class I SAM-dependent methyltransferase [Alteromonas facilis]|uniref:class I SAM-dependent methyltransferase n=1 Tax=Alteromonas facilis TaxID=2048004 RepID=UPI000C289773|nr:class I SAM-dependent methyltransferase [Alteromonas facilis]
MNCPLCSHSNVDLFTQDKIRNYFECHNCHLVFVDPTALPSVEAEKGEYELHQNDDDDVGYLQFLDRARLPLLEFAYIGTTGIDFGCGPNPVLAKRLQVDGYNMKYYDPIFFPDSHVLGKHAYDFIVCTEAIEHFHSPKVEWRLWQRLLKPTGYLVIMTKRWLSKERFQHWHYKNDKTHVSFFHLSTFEYLAEQSQFEIKYVSDDVVVMQRNATHDIISDSN